MQIKHVKKNSKTSKIKPNCQQFAKSGHTAQL